MLFAFSIRCQHLSSEACYFLSDKVKGSYVATLLQGTGYEIQWGTGNKKVRKAFQWLLEQLILRVTQLRRYSVSTDHKAAKPKTTEPEEAGWEFLMEHGKLDKGGLRQLRWIHAQINDSASPIQSLSSELQ